jgi:hypothetical protein
MDADQAKKSVVLVTQAEDHNADAASLLDAVSGKQGLWQIASHVALEPVTRAAAKALEASLEGRFVLLCGRRVATAFGVRSEPWLTLRACPQGLFAVLPSLGPRSRYWSRKDNVKKAKAFFLTVIDHFSRRFGQPPGTFADIAPAVEVQERGRLVITNTAKDRRVTVKVQREVDRVLPPGRQIEVTADVLASIRCVWQPALCAPAVELVVAHDLARGHTEVRAYKTRGLTARELDALCPEPVHHWAS